MTANTRTITPPKNYETFAWKWMRYSGILLIPLVWIHVLIQDVLVGVHAIDLNYVVLRWSMIGWQIYDILLLAFTFAHGMNGLRQVSNDFIHGEKAQRNVAWLLFIVWLLLSAIGAVAILAAAAKNLAAIQ
jgi:succinate dehydrogenase / fumarate reductase membrane anchor subunit